MKGSRFILLMLWAICALALVVMAAILLSERAEAQDRGGQRDYVKCAARATKRLNGYRSCFNLNAVHPTITADTAHAVWKDACRRCKRLRHRMTHPRWQSLGAAAWRPLVRHCFRRQGIGWRENEAIGVIARESGGDPGNVNGSSGASGLFQFMPSWWESQAQALDPWWNVNRAARAVRAQGGWYPAWALTAP